MLPDNFSIRPATADDLPALLSLYRQLNPDDPLLPNDVATTGFTAISEQPGMTVLLGLSGDTVTSTATLAIIPNLTRGGAPYALIENVVTDERYRKRGHAGALIKRAFDHAWSAGCYKVMLLTGKTDAATLAFYEGCGFAQNKTGFQIRRPVHI